MIRTLLGSVCACALAVSTAQANLIVNGDFQTGSLAPSTTVYSQSNDMFAPATWNLTSFDTIHPSWADFYDHTHGDGNGVSMILNGTDSGLGPAWQQTVNVTPNTNYRFSGWSATLFDGSPASLEFRVYDGATLVNSNAFFTPGFVAVWQNKELFFNSGSASSLSVEVWDTSLQFGGNDYGLDDLSVTAGVPEPSTFATLAAIAVASLVYRRWRE
jgi:hypothetical protein